MQTKTTKTKGREIIPFLRQEKTLRDHLEGPWIQAHQSLESQTSPPNQS